MLQGANQVAFTIHNWWTQTLKGLLVSFAVLCRDNNSMSKVFVGGLHWLDFHCKKKL